MPALPQRQSLVAQTAAYLKSEIRRGAWQEWLPGERLLSRTLQVGRNTLRAALQQLASEGVVRAEHGMGCRILTLAAATKAIPRERTVCLLSPQPLERLRPTQTLWIDELRAQLIEQDCRLHVLHGQQYFRSKPGAALEKLTRQHPHGCWILIRSSAGMQAWFQTQHEPCVVAGSCFPGIDLPFVDLDHRALCRHAAGVLLSLGHRRIAFLAERTDRPGDTASEQGFLEGVRTSRHGDAEALVAWHEPTVQSVCSALQRLMEQRRPPTALFVANPFFYLSVVTRLGQLGRRVPADISVLSRDEDPFLPFVLPEPARYTIRAQLFARRLMRPVLERLDGGLVTHRSALIMPEFIRGESLAPPPPAQ